jgi:hypothetical protein
MIIHLFSLIDLPGTIPHIVVGMVYSLNGTINNICNINKLLHGAFIAYYILLAIIKRRVMKCDT